MKIGSKPFTPEKLDKRNVDCRWWVGRRLVPMTTVVKCEPNVVISVVFLVALGL